MTTKKLRFPILLLVLWLLAAALLPLSHAAGGTHRVEVKSGTGYISGEVGINVWEIGVARDVSFAPLDGYRITALNASYADAYHELLEDSLIHFPKPAAKLPPEREPAPLPQRDIVYRAMLGLLPLSAAHRDNLLSRGLTDSAIRQNGYRSLAFGKELRDYVAAQLSSRFDLNGIPGFFYSQGAWRLCAYSGLLVPVRTANGCVQGIQIRRDEAAHMKYAWMSSASKPYGTGARSWVHVAGDRSRKEAVITEGPIKGDVSSALTGGGLFVCLPGVNAISFLPDTLRTLGVRRVWEAFDMDKRNNAQVANAAERLRAELKKAGIPCRTMAWDPACKGIDDFLAMKRSA